MKVLKFCKNIISNKHFFQDYPSVGQILQKARENNINVLFVIGGEDNAYVRRVYYDNLAAFLPGGIDKASALNTDASNILRIVGDSFRVTKRNFATPKRIADKQNKQYKFTALACVTSC